MIALLTIPLIISNCVTIRQLEGKLLAPLPTDNNYHVDPLEDYANPSTPKITLGKGQPVTPLKLSDGQGQHFTTNETKLVLICESGVPTRWLWTPQDWLSTRVEVEVDKRRWAAASGERLFISKLTMEFMYAAGFVPINENFSLNVNISCVNSVQNSSLDPVTCVGVTHEGEQGLPGPLTIELNKNSLVHNCVIVVGLPVGNPDSGTQNDNRNKELDIASLNHLEGSCIPGRSGTWGFCADLGFCKSQHFTNVDTEGCQWVNESMTEYYRRGYAWHLSGFRRSGYCALTRLISGNPAPILFFPGNDVTNASGGNYADLGSANIIEKIKQDSIEIFEIESMEGVSSGRHDFEGNETVSFVCRTILTLRDLKFNVGANISSQEVASDSKPLKVKTDEGFRMLIQNITLSPEVYGRISWISCAGYAEAGWRPIRFSSTMDVTVHPGESPRENLTITELADEDHIVKGHSSILTFTQTIGLSAIGVILLLITLAPYLYFRNTQGIVATPDEEREVVIVNEEISLNEESSIVAAADNLGPLCHGPNQFKYELLPEEFIIEKTTVARLGSGEFGEVYRGKVTRRGDEKERAVAVKMPVEPFTETAVQGLLDELTYLPCLGKHPYVIELVGVYTAQLNRNIIYVFLELCELGSLLNYLEVCEPVEPMGRVEGSSYDMPMTVLSVGDNLAMDMCRWAGEIASGMEYIISKGLLHRDLATRNILLTADKRIKITDFGLARPMNESQTYAKKHNNPLPWKWMAPECFPLPVRESVNFTEKSEVWAFGITLWEIYSFGKEPYPGEISCSKEFANWLDRPGNRLAEPRYCRNNMYTVMCRCWAKDPKERPTFSELIRILRDNATEDCFECGQ